MDPLSFTLPPTQRPLHPNPLLPGHFQNSVSLSDALSLTPIKGSTADCPPELLAQIDIFENIFTVPTDKLKEITAHFVKELERGLTVDGGDIV
jgi:hypothetical protein